MPKITAINSYKIVNSRGDWTLRTKVNLDDGSFGVETVPEGVSKGQDEAVYLSVDRAIEAVNNKISKAIVGQDPFDQENIDRFLIKLDGTENKSELGGNSILSVSLAVAKACASSYKLELYEYLNKLFNCANGVCLPINVSRNTKFPTPMFNVINGGKHAHNGLSFQEFMIIPSSDIKYDAAYEMGVNIYHSLKNQLMAGGANVDVGDEGGFAPLGLDAYKALKLLKSSLGTNYKSGKDVFFGIDAAAGSFYDKGEYDILESNLHLNSYELLNYYRELSRQYEIIYLEDPFHEKNFEAWKRIEKELGGKLMIVGDDLVVTNSKLLKEATDNKYCSAVIVKPNQIGTLTETFTFIKEAKASNLTVCISHRSGDTAEDTFIADLAVAVGADFIKSGAPARGERVAKYNRLLEIFHKLNG